MSILSELTDRRAVRELAKALRHFGKLDFLCMSDADEKCARQAENLLREIIESNGYAISSTGKKITKLKIKKDKP
jgi:hypothetical protein